MAKILWTPAIILFCFILSTNNNLTVKDFALCSNEEEISLELPLYTEAREVLVGAFSDTKWLQMKDLEEILLHLKSFYTEELARTRALAVLEFVQQETDWHSLYRIADINILDKDDNWLSLFVKIEEENHLSQEAVYWYALIKMSYLREGWRISGYNYYK